MVRHCETESVKKLDKAFFLDELDERRFGSPLLDDTSYEAVYFEKPFTFLASNYDRCNRSFIFGARPIDLFALKIALKKSRRVYVFQHALNPIRDSHTFMYFFQNRKKLIKWLIFILLVKLRLILSCRSIDDCGELVVLSHTDQFEKYIKSKVKGFNISVSQYFKLSPPCPLTWGSDSIINVKNSLIEAFYVDEPLDQTLGIQVWEEQNILISLFDLLPIDEVYVKLHPRSNPRKFDFCDKFKVVDSIYKNCSYLIGFNSGLLNYSFIRDFDCRLENQKWVVRPSQIQKSIDLDYVFEARKFIDEK